MRKRLIIGLLCIGVLAGCSDPQPDPVPTPTETATETPTPSPSELTPEELAEQQAEALKAQNIADAKQMITDFYAALNETRSNEFRDWTEKVAPFVIDDKMIEYYAFLEDATRQQGTNYEGFFTVRSITVEEYTPDPAGGGFESITLKLCADRSQGASYTADGTREERPADYQPVLFDSYQVAHQGVGQPWKISKSLGYGAPCAG